MYKIVYILPINIVVLDEYTHSTLVNSLYVFEHPCAHHQESLLYQYDLWYMSLCVGDRVVCRFGWNVDPSKPAYHTVTYIE